ncbi:hypothetical protein [Vibrio barjaei]|uniref:hypothetical protein n=1 Tax=Vibrio barjaei TaxID=1676683 RepID=UPI0022848FEB|nr:hypothetical protein [Vibrio barjaei]MCY9870455.1 hypothetical protein [Vibrio barjaei]
MIELSYLDRGDLIVIGGEFISGEWPAKSVGIELQRIDDTCHLMFHPTDGNRVYQRWIFELASYEPLRRFFMLLSYPVPEQPHLRTDKIK